MKIEPGTSPKHRYELIKATLLVIIGALITITVVYGIPFFSPKEISDPIEPISNTPEEKPTTLVDNTSETAPTTSTVQETLKEKVYSQEELNKIFEMDKKSTDTKLYYSEKLGVGFTYLNTDNNKTVVKEDGNKIYLYLEKWGFNTESKKFLEVFDKDINETLKQAISKKFLNKPNTAKCFVEENQNIYKDWDLREGYIPFTPPNQYTSAYIYVKEVDYKDCKLDPYVRFIDGIGTASDGFLMDNTNLSKYAAIINPPVDEGGLSSGYKERSLQMLSWHHTIRFLK
jgi:hypothetical protein